MRSQRLLRVFGNAEMLSMVLDILKQTVYVMKTVAMSKWMCHVKVEGKECYNFFPISHILPCLYSLSFLFPLCSSIRGDQLLPTCLSVLFRPLYCSSLVSPCSTGLSHSLVTSLMVTMFPLPSTSFCDLPLR